MARTITVKELRDKLKGVPNDANVFILTDASDENWDEENERWINVHAIENIYREKVFSETGMGFDREYNLILEIAQDE